MMKVVGSAKYVHKSNVQELIDSLPRSEEPAFVTLIYNVGRYYDYDIIKYDKGNVTLLQSPDWDTANEPVVGNSFRWTKGRYFKAGGGIEQPSIRRYNPANPQIYHNKWQFVAADYKGFDIAAAKRRTQLWNSIPGIKNHKKKIGYKKYWIALLRENGIPL